MLPGFCAAVLWLFSSSSFSFCSLPWVNSPIFSLFKISMFRYMLAKFYKTQGAFTNGEGLFYWNREIWLVWRYDNLWYTLVLFENNILVHKKCEYLRKQSSTWICPVWKEYQKISPYCITGFRIYCLHSFIAVAYQLNVTVTDTLLVSDTEFYMKAL